METGRGRRGGRDREGDDGEGGNREGRWGGKQWGGGNGEGGNREVGEREGQAHKMPGWNEVTFFSDFVHPCNAGYPS